MFTTTVSAEIQGYRKSPGGAVPRSQSRVLERSFSKAASMRIPPTTARVTDTRAQQVAGALRLLFALLVPVLLGACSSLGYYAQAVDGQLGVLSKRRPIDEVLADPKVSARVKARLRLAQRARRFASDVLDLPDNDSYRSYADLGRPYPAWNVVATKPFSVKPVPQCYLLVGCMSYRGYFHKQAALDHARALRVQGMDVAVVPVTAYSTLGWFDDPIFNSMLRRPRANLVGVIFHELAHQRLYVDGDSTFNESFANFVEREGLHRWFTARGDPQAYRRYLKSRQREAQFDSLLIATRHRLAAVYGAGRSPSDMRKAKARAFAELQRRYRALKKSWGGYAGYDPFMASGLNNANLALVATYEDWIPAFRALFEREDDHFPAFYRAAERIGKLPSTERHRTLAKLADRSAVGAASMSMPDRSAADVEARR